MLGLVEEILLVGEGQALSAGHLCLPWHLKVWQEWVSEAPHPHAHPRPPHTVYLGGILLLIVGCSPVLAWPISPTAGHHQLRHNSGRG